MFNIFNIARDVCEFMIKRCKWMKVYGDEQIVSEMALDDLRQKKVVSV